MTEAVTPPPYLIVEWSGGGGFGHYAWLLGDAITAAGRPVTLCTRAAHELATMPRLHAVLSAWPRQPRRLRGRLRSVAIAVSWVWGWFRVLWYAAKLGQRGVIHLQATARLVEAPFMLVARALGWTVLTTAHNALPHDAGRWQRAVQRVLYRLPHGIVCHSDAAASRIRESGGARTPILVVRFPSFAPIAERFPRISTQRQPRLRVLHFGGIAPYKRFDVVVEAMNRALRDFPEFEFRVAGKPDDPDVVRKLISSLPSERVSAELSYLGLGELLSELDQADVVVLGHRSDSESAVAHLALGAGVPIVAPAGGPIGRLLTDVPEWMYSGGDPADAARVIVRVLHEIVRDGDGARVKAKRLAAAVPSWHVCALQHLGFVQDVRACHRKGSRW